MEANANAHAEIIGLSRFEFLSTKFPDFVSGLSIQKEKELCIRWEFLAKSVFHFQFYGHQSLMDAFNLAISVHLSFIFDNPSRSALNLSTGSFRSEVTSLFLKTFEATRSQRVGSEFLEGGVGGRAEILVPVPSEFAMSSLFQSQHLALCSQVFTLMPKLFSKFSQSHEDSIKREETLIHLHNVIYHFHSRELELRFLKESEVSDECGVSILRLLVLHLFLPKDPCWKA